MRSSSLVALALAVVLPGCGGNPTAPSAAKVPVVRYVTPVDRDVTDYEYFTGRTAAVDHVDVRARVTGYISKVNFKAGTEVKIDDILFVIDPRPYKAALDRSLGQIALAEAKLKLATVELNRGLAIAKTPGAISQGDLDKYAADKSSAEATLQASKAEAESSELNLKWTNVTAPVAGVVSRDFVTVGNLINQDNTLLTTIVSLDPIFGYFDIDENTMSRVKELIRQGKMPSLKENDKMQVHFGIGIEGDKYPHEGIVDFINNQLQASTGTLQARFVIQNPKTKNSDVRMFTPGMFIRVRLPIGPPHRSLLVPQSAIGTEQGKKYLFVVGDKNLIERRFITTGALQADGMQVVEPLKMIRDSEGMRLARNGENGEPSLTAKDKIVVNGLQRIRPGVTVDPKPAAEEKQ